MKAALIAQHGLVPPAIVEASQLVRAPKRKGRKRIDPQYLLTGMCCKLSPSVRAWLLSQPKPKALIAAALVDVYGLTPPPVQEPT